MVMYLSLCIAVLAFTVTWTFMETRKMTARIERLEEDWKATMSDADFMAISGVERERAEERAEDKEHAKTMAAIESCYGPGSEEADSDVPAERTIKVGDMEVPADQARHLSQGNHVGWEDVSDCSR